MVEARRRVGVPAGPRHRARHASPGRRSWRSVIVRTTTMARTAAAAEREPDADLVGVRTVERGVARDRDCTTLLSDADAPPPTDHAASGGGRASRGSCRVSGSEPCQRSWMIRTGITRLANGMNQPPMLHPEVKRGRMRPSSSLFFALRHCHMMKTIAVATNSARKTSSCGLHEHRRRGERARASS